MKPGRLLCLAGLLAAGAAQAQVDLGELLDLGGRQLAAADVLALGETRLRSQRDDADAELTLRTDGSVVGTVHNKQGHGASDALGTWRVAPDGQRCIEVQLPAFRMDVRNCSYLFRLGQDLFLAPSATDPQARVVQYVR